MSDTRYQAALNDWNESWDKLIATRSAVTRELPPQSMPGTPRGGDPAKIESALSAHIEALRAHRTKTEEFAIAALNGAIPLPYVKMMPPKVVPPDPPV